MSDDILNVPEFLERVQDDKELLLELLDIFSDDYVGKRAALGEAIVSKNAGDVRSIAHSVKGASGNISAKQLHALFHTLEEMGKNGNLTGANDILEKVDVQFALLVKKIEQVKKEMS